MTVLEPSIRTACNAELESDVEDVGDVNGEDEWEDDDCESGDEVIDDRIEECLRARPPVGAVCCGRANCTRQVLVTCTRRL